MAQIVEMIEEDLEHLRRVVAANGTALDVDDALIPLIAHANPSIISPILMLLNEDGDQHAMWSILHSAELFDGPIYVAGLLQALHPLSQSCLWWATTLMIRVLNSEAYCAELATQLRGAPLLTRTVAAMICEKLSEDEHFRGKAMPIIAAARDENAVR